MNSSTVLKVIGIVASAILAFMTGLKASGWRSEKVSTDTQVSISAGVEFRRTTNRQVKEGDARQETATPTNTPESPAPTPPGEPGKPAQNSQYVGGNYVSGKSTMRYVLDDNNGDIKMYGYDVMRGRTVFVGSGRMVGRRLIIPKFYSFLDDTYGTLKLELAEDGKTLEGTFEGFNAAQEGRVILMRLP
jgi:hypothetical protein